MLPPCRQRGRRRQGWLLAHASDNPVPLQAVVNRAVSEHIGDSRNCAKALARRASAPGATWPTSGTVTNMIDEGTEFGARVARRLREETVVWLTTVTPAGAPLPRPVGFLWDGDETVVIYSQPGARVRNIAANPKVTLNFDGDGHGGNVVVLSGIARLDADAPTADANRAWLESTPRRSRSSG